MKIGVWFYGLATAIIGILNIVWGDFEASHQPIKSLGNSLPGQHILAYIAGVWLVAVGLAVLFKRTERIGATASAIIYIFFALLWLPRFYTVQHMPGFRVGFLIFIVSGLAQQLLLAAPAGILYATSQSGPIRDEKLTTAARWILGLSPISFGLGHLMNVHIMAGFVPRWIPFPDFWAMITGVAFMLAGIAIASKIRDLLATRLLALMFLLFEGIVEIPPVFAHPHSQQAWGGAVYNLTAIGAYWIFAEFLVSRAARRQIASTQNVALPQRGAAVA